MVATRTMSSTDGPADGRCLLNEKYNSDMTTLDSESEDPGGLNTQDIHDILQRSKDGRYLALKEKARLKTNK